MLIFKLKKLIYWPLKKHENMFDGTLGNFMGTEYKITRNNTERLSIPRDTLCVDLIGKYKFTPKEEERNSKSYLREMSRNIKWLPRQESQFIYKQSL